MKTKPIQSPSLWPRKSEKGSALLTVLIVGMGLLTVVGVTLRWGLTERRLNNQHILRQQAKNASESLVEYGFAELVGRFIGQTSFPSDELENRPLADPISTHSSFFTNTVISTGSGDMKLTGGQITGPDWVYIDPNAPANEFDPFRGQKVLVREVALYGKAKAVPPTYGTAVTSYTIQLLQVRDVPLFSNAIFYNMDLEMHSGSTMDVRGPIHVNGDVWMEAKGSGPLTIHEGLTVTGEILHGRKQYQEHKRSGPVNIKNTGGTPLNMRGPEQLPYAWNTDEGWLDSRDPDFRTEAASRWDGMAQDSEMQVPTLNPLGFSDYLPDDPYTSGIVRENHGYAIIEPVLTFQHQDYKGDTIRQQKFAYKAGILFRVEEFDDPSDGDQPGQVNFKIKAYKYDRTNNSNPVSAPKLDAGGDPILVEIALPPGVIGEVNANLSGIRTDGESDDYKVNNSGSSITVDGKTFNNGDVYGGMFDHRPDIELDLVTIDMTALKNAVENDDAADWTLTGPPNNEMRPRSWWNGVVYVEFPTQVDTMSTTASTNRTDKIVPGKREDVALMLINTDEIPDPYLTDNNFHSDRGSSIATNAPLYTVGDVNADGNSGTGTSMALDDANEPPMALAADTFTTLTENYGVKGRQNSIDNYASNSNRPGAYTEISAALLTGLIPTIPDDAPSYNWESSGGVHNFPRMIEYWGGTTMRIRGSLVSLFESEVHSQPRPSGYTHYYRWPTRDFGFNDNFRNGIYPPGSPNARNFRRVAFRDITSSEYNTAIANLFP